ncbi:MAG: hypothetical protein HKN04_08330 [Rhodothermaceae bacterium]|nr:hypothetical protein [Rhodothermaceae bacterium]
MTALLSILLFWAQPFGHADRASNSQAHDPHVTYTDMAVEGAVMVCRIRFFQDDLELALSLHRGSQRVRMAANPEVDAVFMDYLREHVTLQANEETLMPTILGSGEDVMDREPAWWYTLQFTASSPVEALHVRNTMMFELFEDQQHVLKVMHFPDETERSYYLIPGEEDVNVAF